MVPALLASSALPIFARAARDDHERLGYAIGRVFEVSLIVGAWVAVSIAVGATLAVEVIGGKAYAPAAPVLAFQGVALGAMFVSVVWANALLSLGLYRLILVISLGALALNSILVALLVTGGGARGAAIATASPRWSPRSFRRWPSCIGDTSCARPCGWCRASASPLRWAYAARDDRGPRRRADRDLHYAVRGGAVDHPGVSARAASPDPAVPLADAFGGHVRRGGELVTRPLVLHLVWGPLGPLALL